MPCDICMYVCFFVSIYVCMYVYMYVCVYVCLYVCMYVTSMHVCIHVCMHVCHHQHAHLKQHALNTCMLVYYRCLCVYVRMYMSIHIILLGQFGQPTHLHITNIRAVETVGLENIAQLHIVRPSRIKQTQLRHRS